VKEQSLTLLGQRIRERRKSFGWNQEELAHRASVDRSYVGGIERGERNITFTMLCQLCRALQCTVPMIADGLPLGIDEAA